MAAVIVRTDFIFPHLLVADPIQSAIKFKLDGSFVAVAASCDDRLVTNVSKSHYSQVPNRLLEHIRNRRVG
jgi:hypothetical protein